MTTNVVNSDPEETFKLFQEELYKGLPKKEKETNQKIKQ